MGARGGPHPSAFGLRQDEGNAYQFLKIICLNIAGYVVISSRRRSVRLFRYVEAKAPGTTILVKLELCHAASLEIVLWLTL